MSCCGNKRELGFFVDAILFLELWPSSIGTRAGMVETIEPGPITVLCCRVSSVRLVLSEPGQTSSLVGGDQFEAAAPGGLVRRVSSEVMVIVGGLVVPPGRKRPLFVVVCACVFSSVCNWIFGVEFERRRYSQGGG